MLRGYHESVVATLFRPLTLELCSRPPSCFPAKYPPLNSNKKTLLQICSPIALRRATERLCEVRGGGYSNTTHAHRPNPTQHTHRHPWVYPVGSLLKQTPALRAASRSPSGPDEDGARPFVLFRGVIGFYSCPRRHGAPARGDVRSGGRLRRNCESFRAGRGRRDSSSRPECNLVTL